jgi:exonuclease VII small subunit
VPSAGSQSIPSPHDRLEAVVASFSASVTQLESVVAHFDAALKNFANTTRDFREFNLHLKDNIQRMSLSFGDLSDTLNSRIGDLKGLEIR